MRIALFQLPAHALDRDGDDNHYRNALARSAFADSDLTAQAD